MSSMRSWILQLWPPLPAHEALLTLAQGILSSMQPSSLAHTSACQFRASPPQTLASRYTDWRTPLLSLVHPPLLSFSRSLSNTHSHTHAHTLFPFCISCYRIPLSAFFSLQPLPFFESFFFLLGGFLLTLLLGNNVAWHLLWRPRFPCRSSSLLKPNSSLCNNGSSGKIQDPSVKCHKMWHIGKKMRESAPLFVHLLIFQAELKHNFPSRSFQSILQCQQCWSGIWVSM